MAVNKFNQGFKRVFDLIAALILLVCLSPVILLIAIWIKIDSPGEIVFKQKRLGRNGKIFYLMKFRSMVKDAVNKGTGMLLEENDTRITRVGKILRKTSLDELPQLINVIRGEMSMVGPRPAPIFHLDKYDQEQRRRLLVRPGITGWAQVNGRVALYWPQRIELDLWYINNYSFRLDLLILFRTFTTIFDKKSSTAKADRKDVDPFMKW